MLCRVLLFSSVPLLCISLILFQDLFEEGFFVPNRRHFFIQNSLCGYAALSVTAGRQKMPFCFTQRHLDMMNTPSWCGAMDNICSSSSAAHKGWTAKQRSSGAEDLMFVIDKLMEVWLQTSSSLGHSPFWGWNPKGVLLICTVQFRLIPELSLCFPALLHKAC